MPSTHRNRLITAISNTPSTTGSLIIASAAAGYRTFGAADNGLSFDVSIVDGTAWEIRTGCVYTHAGTSLSRGTLEDSSTGSAIALTSAAVLTVTMTAGFGTRLNSSALTHVVGADADTTMNTGNVYIIDMSTWASSRTYTLPAACNVGDRVGVIVSNGSMTNELLITAASGDTLNEVSGGTEWSRVFMTDEVVILRCVVANAAWIVEVDGRISIKAVMKSSGTGSVTQSCAASTYTDVNANLFAETVIDNANAMGADAGSKIRFTARRSGVFSVSAGLYMSLVQDQKTFIGGVTKNDSTPDNSVKIWRVWSSGTGGALANTGSSPLVLANADYLKLIVFQGGSTSANLQDNGGFSFFAVTEVL